jgi:cation-transporting P-type ATPase F
LMLSFEPKEPTLMRRKPRSPEQPILTRYLTLRIGLVGVMLLTGAFGLFQWELAHGQTLANARTVAVNVFVFGQLFYLFNCRSLHCSIISIGFFSNPLLIVGVIIMVSVQLLFTYGLTMNRLFGSSPIDGFEWLLIIMVGIIIYLIIEVEKSVYCRINK